MLARTSLAMGVIPEVQQRGRVVISNEPNAAAVAPIPTVGATFGDVSFAAKRHTASTAVAPLHVDVALVYKVAHEKKVSIHAQKPAR